MIPQMKLLKGTLSGKTYGKIKKQFCHRNCKDDFGTRKECYIGKTGHPVVLADILAYCYSCTALDDIFNVWSCDTRIQSIFSILFLFHHSTHVNFACFYFNCSTTENFLALVILTT